MFDRINKLKILGYEPNIIIDIGAHHGNWSKSVFKIYSDAKYYLFEAIDYKQLDIFMSHKNFKVFKPICLNNENTEVDWYEKRNTGDSFFKENTNIFKDVIPIKKQTFTFDTIIESDEIIKKEKNIFIKIDCQGAEIPILQGAKSIIPKTDFILLEVPLFGKYNENVPSFLEHISYMDSIGFVPYDILENHYIHHFNMQLDMLFINKNHSFLQKVQNNL